jgi:hypothetical protein
MRTRTFASALAAFALLAAAADAQTLPKAIMDSLEASGSLYRTAFKGSSGLKLEYAPSGSFADASISVLLKKEPELVIEGLYLLKSQGKEISSKAIMDRLRSLRSLEGIQYYSVNKGGMKTLFVKSYAIDGPTTKKAIPDPIRADPPESELVYVLQEDLSFGENVYAYSFRRSGAELGLLVTNLTMMRYGIINAVEPSRLTTVLLALPRGPDYILYVATGAKVAMIPGLRDRVAESFMNRAKALIDWLKAGL